ncbi:ketosteroid isomerase-like protein [Nocardioides luteus]|uniref:nuclear transport factor 2 family protein n=1 Tax=Nocardioides luteus TaxID=1844 RepID=UPI0016635AD1|nr:nuclear transport factor 2 family protein [Nocardioides luteus]MDR7312337.1 ketosteroid isomerase-like protein [Nocardioides luteus]
MDTHDEAEIKSVILDYVEALDGRDFDRIASVFTDTAELENTFEAYIPGADAFTGVLARGAHAIAESVGGLMGRIDATQHFLGAMWFDLTDDGVRTRTQVIAHHHRGGGHYHTGGTYTDYFVRTKDGWRIRRRELHTVWTTGDASVVSGA